MRLSKWFWRKFRSKWVYPKILEQMSSPQDSGANEFTPVFRSKWVHPNIPEQMSSPQEFCCTCVAQSLLFNVVFCKSLFVLLAITLPVFCHYFACLLAITLPVFWPLLCLSFGHYFVCLLAITLPVFWPLLGLSFGHYFACLSINGFWLPLLYLQNISSITWISNPSTLSVSGEGYSRNASDYPFGIYKLLFYYRQLWIRHLRNLYTFPKTSKSIKT